MPPEVDFDNPTKEEVDRFKEKLIERLLFEPVLDADFFRPTAKLHALVTEAQSYMSRLQTIRSSYDTLLGLAEDSAELLKEFALDAEAILGVGFTPQPAQEFKYAVADNNHVLEEWERGHALYEKKMRLRQLAQSLSLRYVSLHPADRITKARLSMSRIDTLQTLILLTRITERVLKDTSRAYDQSFLDIKELLSESANKAIEKADLVNPLPAVILFTSLFKYIQREERRQRREEDFERKTGLRQSLATFLAWWDDGDGRNTVQSTVLACEKLNQQYELEVRNLVEQTLAFVQMLSEYKTTREATV